MSSSLYLYFARNHSGFHVVPSAITHQGWHLMAPADFDPHGLIMCVAVSDNAIAVTALATVGRFLMNGAGTVCNIYVQELFPTSIRYVTTIFAVSTLRNY